MARQIELKGRTFFILSEPHGGGWKATVVEMKDAGQQEDIGDGNELFDVFLLPQKVDLAFDPMVPREPFCAAAFRPVPCHQQDCRQLALDPGKYLDYVGRSLDRSKVGEVNQNFFSRRCKAFSEIASLGRLVDIAIYKVVNHVDLVLHAEALVSSVAEVL